MGQPLFHSRQITHLGEPIAWEQWARQGRTTVQYLRDLLRSGAAQPAQEQEMALLQDAMPAPWAAHIYKPSPQPTHLASVDPADRRTFCPSSETPPGHGVPATQPPSSGPPPCWSLVRCHCGPQVFSSSQTTGGARGSHQQSWPAYGSASDCCSSHSSGQHTARLDWRTIR